MSQPTGEGTTPFLVPDAGKDCLTYYKIFGDIKSPDVVPCVLVHGGPGLSHDYMLSYLPLYERFGIPLVLYDQLGNGLSTHLPEKAGDREFWTEELFHRELSNLLRELGLDDRGYNLLGHSWGGMMGSTFAAKQPKGLRKLVLSNSPATVLDWFNAYRRYRSQLPKEMQDTLQRHEDAGTEDDKEYEDIMVNVFYKEHMISIIPWPQDFTKSFEWAAKDATVIHTMLGRNEFNASGSLQTWSAVESLKRINAPTLVINGTEEGASDEAVMPFVEQIKDVKWVKFDKSSHMTVLEEPEKYFDLLGDFLMGS